MKLWKDLTPEGMETIPNLRGQDFEFIRNLGVVLPTDETLSQLKTLTRFNNCFFIRCNPTLDLYQDKTEPIEYPPFLLACFFNKEGVTESHHHACYDQDEEVIEKILPFVDERIPLLTNVMLNTPAGHPHVGATCGICTGTGNGMYSLNGTLEDNQRNIVMFILDLKRWASSVNLGGAYYAPSSVITSILSDRNLRIISDNAALRLASFNKFEDQKAICFFAGFLKNTRNEVLHKIITEEFNKRLIIERDESIKGPMKVIRMVSPFSIDHIKAFYAIDLIIKVSRRHAGIEVFSSTSFVKKIEEHINNLLNKELDMRKFYVRLKDLITIIVESGNSRIDKTLDDARAFIEQGKYLAGDYRLAYIFETNENLQTLIDSVRGIPARSYSIDFTNIDTIISSIVGGSDKYELAAKQLAKIAIRAHFVETHNALVQARQAEGELHDLMHHYQANVGEDPLLP